MAKNRLYYGDNLHVLREEIPSESVDLIYLDPPFNSKRDYNVLFKTPKGNESQASITAFEDAWHWGEQAEDEYYQLFQQSNTGVSEIMRALRSFLGENDMMAYLTMMATRLLELHRVLKPTGSLYLHCDPTASHYLKVLLDGTFGRERFQSEIIWHRTSAKGLAFAGFPNNHDTIFLYAKGENAIFNRPYVEYEPDNLDEKTARKYCLRDPDGRLYQLTSLLNPNPNRPNLTYEFLGVTRVWRWTKERMQEAYERGIVVQTKSGAVPRMKRYLDEQEGRPIDTVWVDIPPINSQAQERLGYPTQKPLALLGRIIQASSNPGDVVLDPFCGCGTAVHAAQKLSRKWIGIDITHLAVSLIEKRLRDAFGDDADFEVIGTPKDIDAARDLAQRDKYQFQFWAVSLVNAQPFQGKKKGADGGIDGIKYFHDIKSKEPKKIVVSVKGGDNVGLTMLKDLITTVAHNKAEIGCFVTLTPPTQPMIAEAAKAGFYVNDMGGKVPRIQILTIDDLMSGKKRLEHPDYVRDTNFKKARRESTERTKDLFD